MTRILAKTAAATLAVLAAAPGLAAATPPEGLLACADNSLSQTEQLLSGEGLDYPAPPCKPLT